MRHLWVYKGACADKLQNADDALGITLTPLAETLGKLLVDETSIA